ncbi:hypothetical protein J6590_092809 [Homalodisca vitripennis]|nr:hypothetical protein J6590_092809 [Homalodisca vitripennis]
MPSDYLQDRGITFLVNHAVFSLNENKQNLLQYITLLTAIKVGRSLLKSNGFSSLGRFTVTCACCLHAKATPYRVVQCHQTYPGGGSVVPTYTVVTIVSELPSFEEFFTVLVVTSRRTVPFCAI